jgi:hypothetical protein
VEQVITTVNIALRRQMSQLDFYTAGNVPDSLAQVPDTWTPKQITEFQLDFDALLDGNSANKRKMKFIPALKQLDFPKKDLLKDEFDEWLARIVCFAFSISPSALIKQVNRASGEQMADTAKEEGLIPVLSFLNSFMTQLLGRAGYPGLKFKFKIVNKVAPKDQALIDQIYLDEEVVHPDEVRESLGKPKLSPEEREKLFPTPVQPGMNADGTPIEPKATPQPTPQPTPAPKKEEPSAAEKMLADALRMLDPEKIAKVIADVQRSQPAMIIEHKPEIAVTVGDTNVHVPVAKSNEAAIAQAVGAGMAQMADAVSASGAATAEAIAKMEPAQVKVEVGETNVHLPAEPMAKRDEAAPTVINLQPVINMPEQPAPVVNITNEVPQTNVEVHLPEQGATEETIQRDDNGSITRVVKRPIK